MKLEQYNKKLEQYNKLKQLDRIEYTLILNNLKEKYGLIFPSFVWTAVLFMMSFYIIGLLFYSTFGEFNLLRVSIQIGRVFKYAFFLIIGLDILGQIKFYKARKALDKHFL